jgi:hypothetical protein
MRGTDTQQSQIFSYLSPEQRVRKGHALRAVRTMVDEVLRELPPQFSRMYSISQRKRIEECFGWLKTIALLRKMRHRGVQKVDWVFAFACAAYNLVHVRNLSIQPA